MVVSRVRAFAVVGVLIVAALIVASMAIARDRQPHNIALGDCRRGDVPVNAKLPASARDVRVNILDTSGRDGAAGVAHDFRNRRFDVVATGDENPADGGVVIRYGPKALGGAWWVRAYFLDRAVARFDPTRTDDVVDVLVGPEPTTMGTEIEAKQALAQMGGPKLPTGTCDARTLR